MSAQELLKLADDELVLGWRNSEWTGIAPFLEEDVAFSSIAQTEIGHARAWYELAAKELGTDADSLAFDREPDEYASGHVPGAVQLSVHEIDRRLGEVPAARDARIVTICKSGKRSAWAAMFLRVAGYRDVRSVPGGTMAWRQQGRRVNAGPTP